MIRTATHSGSWYTSNGKRLEAELESFLEKAGPLQEDARFLIGPHAGYSYAGETLAKTYGAWDTTKVKRIFLMGPSHHTFFNGHVLLSGCDSYDTPLGCLPIDVELVEELCVSYPNFFGKMTIDEDEDEHSLEMHCPFIYKMTENLPQGIPKVVPILVSGKQDDVQLAEYLKPFLQDESNTFAVSTDFCHWGGRFSYTGYTTDMSGSDFTVLSSRSSNLPVPIYKSIEMLDKLGMEYISALNCDDWKKYLRTTRNTICGAKPLTTLVSLLEGLGKVEWVGYSQSSKARSVLDTSVSYAAGYAVCRAE